MIMTDRDKQTFLQNAIMHALPAVVDKYSDPDSIAKKTIEIAKALLKHYESVTSNTGSRVV